MKTNILNIEGKKVKEIDLPKFFSAPIRKDIIAKVLEAKKTKQPYAPSPVAGKQHSASGKITKKRHAWKSHAGRGISRVPRKIITRRGGQFNWIGAEISSTRGGRRAHPPKILSMINTKKINKKEQRIAFLSALSATANKKEIAEKYSTLGEKDLKNKELPIIVEDKIATLKIKELIGSLKNILGEKLFNTSISKKSIRAGKGKMRGRKYKKSAGILIVIGKNEKINMKTFDVKKADSVGILDLAKGGPGRLAVYTEDAIKDLQKRIEGNKEKSGEKEE